MQFLRYTKYQIVQALCIQLAECHIIQSEEMRRMVIYDEISAEEQIKVNCVHFHKCETTLSEKQREGTDSLLVLTQEFNNLSSH